MKLSTTVTKVNFLFFLISGILAGNASAQCPTDVNYGQNIVVNGDFTNGYTGWTFASGAGEYKIKGSGNSLPRDILVGTNPNAQFNSGFSIYGDHTTGSGNFLMVDGVCTLGIKLWQQTVTVVPNTNYYFSVWMSSLKDNPTNPGILNFDVGGSNIGLNITAPLKGGASTVAAGGGWIKHEVVWNSGATSGNVVLSIENQNTTDCGNQVDFGIDDIAFIPGCGYGVTGPEPKLGPDQSLCGKGGSITLNANVPQNATTTVTWSDGTTGFGLSAPYTKVVTSPGTYSVCVSDNGSCTKSDVVVISGTFSINIGANVDLCTITTKTLDAGYTGLGTTYKWYKNGVAAPGNNDRQTYSANSAGTYSVDVTVAGCGTQSSSMAITTSNSATPTDAYYCNNGATPTLSVAGSGTYVWYDALNGGSTVTTGLSYTLPAITNNPADQVFYVQDNKTYTGTAGSTNYLTSDQDPGYDKSLKFTFGADFAINSLQIPFVTYYSDGDGEPGFTVTIEVVDANGASFTPAKTFTSGTSLQAIPANDGNNTRLYTFPFTTFNVSEAWGTTLRLKLKSSTHPNGAPKYIKSGYTFPINSTPTGYITITDSYTGDPLTSGGYDADGYAYFFNWSFSGVTFCERVPVRAVNNCPLPVSWKSFELTHLNNNSCQLTWSTAFEIRNKYYTIERASKNSEFEVIGRIDKIVNSNRVKDYLFIDSKPLSGISYYRIVQYDENGESSSTVIKEFFINSNSPFQIRTYPNPFDEASTLIVDGPGEDKGTYRYSISSVLGQQLESGNGVYGEKIAIGGNLSKGVYFLDVKVNREVRSIKLVKN